MILPRPTPPIPVNAFTPIPGPDPEFGPESDAERRARQLAALREVTELGLLLARAAAARALDPAPADPEQPPPPDPTLAFARAAAVIRHAIALENRIAAGPQAAPLRPAHNPDPRRPKLRQTLHKLADSEPDRAARNQLRRDIDDRLDDELGADPDAELPLAEILIAVCDDLGLPIDLAKLPSEFLKIPTPTRPATPDPPD